MSALLAFLRGEGPDGRGRRIAAIWAMSDAELEASHDFIQWLFPLPEPSGASAHAPILAREDIEAFAAEPALGIEGRPTKRDRRALDRARGGA